MRGFSRYIVPITLISLSFIAGILVYPKTPELMASHWNIEGQVNGYIPKLWGLFLLPFVSLGLFIFLNLIPKIDPLRKNIQEFRKEYDNFILVLLFFLLYLHLFTIAWNLDFKYNIMQILSPGLAALFYFSGVMSEKSKPNWFIGIRTPWTLSSPVVWEKTNKIGGKLFKILGRITLLGVIFPNFLIYIFFIPLIIFILFIFIYSYHEYSKEKKPI